MPRKKTTTKQQQPSTGTLALQWLTYALWACLAIVSLISSSLVISFFMTEQIPTIQEIAYLLTAMVILLAVATTVDFIYSKHENTKKKQPFTLVTTVHAVIFTLALVVSLIAAAFNLVNHFIEYGSDLTSTKISLSVSSVAILLSAALVVRTTLAWRPKLSQQVSRWTLILVPAILIIVGTVFILPKSSIYQRDSLVEMALMDTNLRINEYANTNDSLPSDLSKLNLEGNSKKILDENLINYTPDTRKSDAGRHYYKLCGTYKLSSPSTNREVVYGGENEKSFDHYKHTDFAQHSEGEQCYKLYVDKNDPVYK